MPASRGFPTASAAWAAAGAAATFRGAAPAAAALAVPSQMVGLPRLPPVGPVAPIAAAALTAYAIWKAGPVAVDFFNWYRSGGKTWLPPNYAMWDPFAGWVTTCDQTGSWPVSFYRYGPGTTCGGLGFEPLGNWKTDELHGWQERVDIGLPGWHNVRFSAIRSDGVVPPLPPAGAVPGTKVPQWTADPYPVREWGEKVPVGLVEAVAMTEALSDRGYDVPTRAVAGAEPLRVDAYAANPGRTFVWEVAAPGVRPLPVPLPIPGVNAPVIPGVAPATGEVVAVVPGGATVIQPMPSAVEPLFPARPAPYVKEKKARMSISGQASLIPGGTAGLRLFNMATETCDAVNALFKAIPFKYKLKTGIVKRIPKKAKFNDNYSIKGNLRPDWQKKDMRQSSYAFDIEKYKPGERQEQKYYKKQFTNPSCYRKAMFIAKGGWHHMDTKQAFWNLVEEQFQDAVIGGLAGAASKAYAKQQRRTGTNAASPLLGPTL